MTDDAGINRHERAPLSSASVQGRWNLVLTVALILYVVLTYLLVAVTYTFWQDAAGAWFPQGGLLVAVGPPLLVLAASIFLAFFGASRVASKLRGRPTVMALVLAAAAVGFLLSSPMPVAIPFIADVENAMSGTTSHRIRAIAAVVAAGWLVAAAIWGFGSVLAERRRRSGRPYARVVVLTGLLMAALEVGSWFLTIPLM